MGTTFEKLKGEIESELGLSGRAVELRDPDYQRAIKAALQKLAKAHPQVDHTVLPITVSVQKYLVDVPNLLMVRDVTFFNNGGRMVFFPYPDPSVDHRLIMSEMKVMQKEYGTLPNWDFNIEATGTAGSETEKGYLYIYFNSDSFIDRSGRLPNYVSIEYLWHLEPTNDKKKGLPRLRYDWEEWVTDYATARAKKILGGIRNKFKGIPGPDGQLLGIDGDQLINDAKEEMKALEADLHERQRQLPVQID